MFSDSLIIEIYRGMASSDFNPTDDLAYLAINKLMSCYRSELLIDNIVLVLLQLVNLV